MNRLKRLETNGLRKLLTQMTAKAGIRLYGEEAVQAFMQEFSQLDYLGVFLAKSANELTREQKVKLYEPFT